jgi:hypothetical protein
MRLRDDSDALGILVGRVAEETGIPIAHVEKDFWLTEALRGMARLAEREKFTLLFKGGTSLSKAYRIIERFSEDVDVLVVLPTGSKGEQDRVLRRLVDEAVLATGVDAVAEAGGTTKAVKRAARLNYPSDQFALAGMTSGLLVEIGSRGGTLPHERLTIRSLIAEHSNADMSEVEEAEPFDVSVLTPVRTLVEKLVLLHTAHADGDANRIGRTARHYYDVHELLGRPEVVAEIATHGIDALARDVVTYSTAAELPASARPAGGFANSPAFTLGSPFAAQAHDAYDKLITQFVWLGSPIPTFAACVERVHVSAGAL